MSDRAEFYRRFPVKPNQMTLREPVLVPMNFARNENNGKWWAWRNEPDYRMWRLTVPIPEFRPDPVYVVWFDDWGNFLQANGEGMVFYSYSCFVMYLEGVQHESEVCRRAV